MRAPFLARSTTAAPLARGAQRSLALATWGPLAAVFIVALILRLLWLDGYVTYYPDSYGQLRAASNLASLDFPVSYYYPPGIAVFLAPFFVVLPDTLLTMQAAIMLAGLALVPLAYLWCRTTTGDARAALLFAAAVALGATFVFHSRVGFFDVINTLLIGLTLLLAPAMVRRGLAAQAAYGLLVFAMVTVRYTNVIVLPALLLASLDWRSGRPIWRDALDRLRSRPVIVVGLVLLALFAVYLGTSSENLTRFGNSGYGSIIDFGGYLPRLGEYWRASLSGYEGSFTWQEAVAGGGLLALAAVGAHRLWHVNRALLAPVAYLVIVWSPVHAVYELFWARYTMPVFFLLLMLAALGLSRTLGWFRQLSRPWQRVSLVAFLTVAVSFFVGQQLAQDVLIYAHAGDVAKSEAAYEHIRGALRHVDGENAVLISSQALAVDRANEKIETLDLARFSASYGINADSAGRLLAWVQEEQAAEKTVYYHYTPYEDAGSRFQRYELGFDAYFTALGSAYELRELARASERPHRLYVLEPKPTE